MRPTLAALEVWLRSRFADATVECNLVDRTPDLTFTQVVLDELHAYWLFRIKQPAARRLQVGVTTLALDRLDQAALEAGLGRAIDQRVPGTGDDRFILQTDGRIVHEMKGEP